MNPTISAEIITIGDEILIGQIVDTNSAWMAQQLNRVGIRVKQVSSVADEREHILQALAEARGRADIILMTGGLGPTKDDVTKITLCEYFQCGMHFEPAQYEQIETLFRRFGRKVNDMNRRQADVPDACTCLVNRNGTAPGMWFERDGKIYVSMAGVPYEMMELMEQEVIPRLQAHFNTPAILHRTFLTQGIAESILAGWIKDWENNLPAHMKLAYLPSPGIVRLRISTTGGDAGALAAEVEQQARKLYDLIGEHIYGEGETTLPEVLLHLMTGKGVTLSVAESCTGGNIARLLTLGPGTSAYFEGGAVTYSNKLKMDILGVQAATLEQYGAVSEETVREMAAGARRAFHTDYAIAVSGIAGPDGGTAEKPIGTVWVAVAGPNVMKTKLFHLGQNRERNITMASLNALTMLRRMLLEQGKDT